MTLAIMFKESFRVLDLATLGLTAMVIFIVTFVAMTLWAVAQRGQDVRHWADLPLAEDAECLKSRKQELP